MTEERKKIAVITGSTRGIGKEIARAFARSGAIPIILGRREEDVQKTVGEIAADGRESMGIACDVTQLSDVKEMANKVLDKYKTVDILINNAGITKDNLLLRMSEDDWEQVMNVNLRGVFNCTKVFSKVMLKARQGRIINISSVIGITGNAGQANYAASKAGIIGFTKSVARELVSRNITANAIAPGYIQTDMTDQLPDNVREEILKNIPLGRFGSPEDVSGICLFLASSQADYITGQTIVVDGGMAI